MKFKIIFAVWLLVFTSNYYYGQTADEIEKRYGSGIFHEIRPTVLMSAEFDKDGQVCSVSFQPNRISKIENTTYLGVDTLDPEILKGIFDEIVPPVSREGKFESMGFIMTGSMGFAAVFWENVRFNVQYSIGRRNKRLMGMSQKGKDGIHLLFSFTPIQPDLAYITWTKRQCVE